MEVTQITNTRRSSVSNKENIMFPSVQQPVLTRGLLHRHMTMQKDFFETGITWSNSLNVAQTLDKKLLLRFPWKYASGWYYLKHWYGQI